jgi:hypothetical protein
MDPWQGWSAEDWVRHYAAPPSADPGYASGQTLADRAAQAVHNANERAQQGLQRASTQLHDLLDAPGRAVSAVELEAERLAQRAKQGLDEERQKLEKPMKVLAFSALAILGILAIESSGKK